VQSKIKNLKKAPIFKKFHQFCYLI